MRGTQPNCLQEDHLTDSRGLLLTQASVLVNLRPKSSEGKKNFSPGNVKGLSSAYCPAQPNGAPEASRRWQRQQAGIPVKVSFMPTPCTNGRLDSF